ncbi:MAG: sigma-70 family RNA polymerase sigma factor [Deltaproteobacteria bacterium]|nr:sigma-70 family RNA polymerase sigma factor [Deltaproteobacteria bacterium]
MKKKEKDFLAKLKAGEEEALGRLINDYSPLLYRYGMRFISNKKEVEDLVQETLLAVMTGIDRFKGESTLQTWIIQIFRLKAYDLFKQQEREPAYESDDLEYLSLFDERGMWREELSAWKHNPENLLLTKELSECLDRAIDQLPPLQKQVLILRDVEELDSDEVCNILGISSTNMRVILHRARLRVRGELSQWMKEKSK